MNVFVWNGDAPLLFARSRLVDVCAFFEKQKSRQRHIEDTLVCTRSRWEKKEHNTTTRCRRRRQSGRQLNRTSDPSAVYIRELEIATDVNSSVAGWSTCMHARDVSRSSPIGCPRDLICKRQYSSPLSHFLLLALLLSRALAHSTQHSTAQRSAAQRSQCQMPNKRLVFFLLPTRERYP